MNARIIQVSLWCLVTMLFLFCAKEDNVPDPQIDSLVGTWTVSEGTIESPSLGTFEAITNGTITFRNGGTGQENYSYTIAGIMVREDDGFTWTSSTNTVVFDAGTDDETVWDRIINESNRQQGKYTILQDGEMRTITLTLTR